MGLLRKGILASTGQGLCVLLQVGVGILFSRILGPDGLGQFELFRQTAHVVLMLLAVGLGKASIYFLNNRGVPAGSITTNTVKMGAVLALLLAAGLTTAFLAVPQYFGRIDPAAAVIFSVGMGLHLCMILLQPILTARLDVRRLMAADLLNSSLLLVMGVLAAMRDVLTTEVALCLAGASYLGGLSLLLWFLRADIHLRQRFDWSLFREVLGYGAVLAVTNSLEALVAYVVVMVLRFRLSGDFAALGLYVRAFTFSQLMLLVPKTVGPLFYAQWSRVRGPERVAQAELAARASLAYGVLAASTVMVFGAFVIRVLYGAEFLGAVPPLRLLAGAILVLPVGNVCKVLLAGDGKAGVAARIYGAAVLVVAVVAGLAVPRWGICGAALGALCGGVFTVAVFLAVCRKRYGLSVLRCLVLRWSDLRYILRELGLARPGDDAA